MSLELKTLFDGYSVFQMHITCSINKSSNIMKDSYKNHWKLLVTH